MNLRWRGSLLVLAEVGVQTAIPFKREVEAGADVWSRLGAVMLICIAVLALVLYLLRRHLNLKLKFLVGQAASTQRLQVLETRRLGPRAYLHVVQFGGREHLIGNSEHGLVTLASAALPGDAEIGSEMRKEPANEMV
jgi:flagellar biogenesis protein FliO